MIDYKTELSITEPVIHHKGLLSETAYIAAGETLDPSTFRSIGYFGIGFGGNTGDHGKISQMYSLEDIDLSRFTHINIAFLAVGSDGHLTIPNSFASQGTSQSINTPAWLTGVNASFTTSKSRIGFDYVKAIFEDIHRQVAGNTTNNGVKIMPCIGGWNISNNTGTNTNEYGVHLNELAYEIEGGESTAMYDNFKEDLLSLLNNGLMDGLDIDWEYPGRPPIASMCKDMDQTRRECKVSEPSQIGPCTTESGPECVSFSYTESELISSRCVDENNTKETYRLPESTPTGDDLKYTKPTHFQAFIEKIRTDSLTPELSIAMAGAPWGLHWYVNTVVELIKANHLDFVNIMAYDYNGFWGNGQVSGFLSNFTNMDIMDKCKNTFWSTCVKDSKILFDSSNDNVLSVNTEPTYCPFIFYNVLKENSDTTDVQREKMTTYDDAGAITEYVWFDGDTQKSSADLTGFDKKENGEDDLAALSTWSSRLTLSAQTMLHMFTDVFEIPKDKLVLGLPYYGRNFQSKVGTRHFADNSYGLYQPYEYGSAYSYSDIHEKHYKTKEDVYTIPLTSAGAGGYTEDIVYTTNNIITHLTPDMTEEMISYNSIESIQFKVDYLKTNNFGGYMSWHMLSDYYADAIPVPLNPSSVFA